jgi:pimeloyl-ACP methyl ester carboxylesterase
MHVTSKDGTRIAYEKTGNGRALLVVTGALADRSAGAELAQLLASRFTVYTYDRRGRGDSGDTKPYSVQREVEDIAALVEAAGGSAFVYGKSSGACLSVQAAASLGDKVKRLVLYEAPYIDAEGAAGEWRALRSKIDELLAADRRAEAVAYFLQFVGMPDEALAQMKASPAWAGMTAMAPTLAYDNAVVGDDRSVPVAVAAKIKASTLVMDGDASAAAMPFMRPTADKLASAIPDAQRRTIEGQDHQLDAKVLAPILVQFFE